LSLTFNWSFSS